MLGKLKFNNKWIGSRIKVVESHIATKTLNLRDFFTPKDRELRERLLTENSILEYELDLWLDLKEVAGDKIHWWVYNGTLEVLKAQQIANRKGIVPSVQTQIESRFYTTILEALATEYLIQEA